MNKDAADQLTNLLTAMAHYSREAALKLKALERIAQERPVVFHDYEKYLEDIRSSPEAQKSHEDTEEALDKLRQALRQE